MSWDPKNEGVDHINIYSKSKTFLGRFMSNFYKIRVDGTTKTISPFGAFQIGKSFPSIEHWWFYQLTNHGDCLNSSIKPYEIKKKMTQWIKDNGGPVGEIDKVELKKLLKHKIMNYSKGVLINFLITDLPFAHYYVFDDRVVQAKEQFLVTMWEEIRKELKYELNTLFNGGYASSNLTSWQDQNIPWLTKEQKEELKNGGSFSLDLPNKLTYEEALLQAKNKQFSKKLDGLLSE